MSSLPYLPDRSAVADALSLIALHGPDAVREARARASRSRGLGNHIHFCRWRQVARLIALLDDAPKSVTLH